MLRTQMPRGMSPRELAEYASRKFGSKSGNVTKAAPRDPARQAAAAQQFDRQMAKSTNFLALAAHKDTKRIQATPRFQAAVEQTRLAAESSRRLGERVKETRAAVGDMARRAEEIARETAEIRQRAADARMHTESRMNMARKKHGRRAVAQVERRLERGDRRLANVARQMGLARAGG